MIICQAPSIFTAVLQTYFGDGKGRRLFSLPGVVPRDLWPQSIKSEAQKKENVTKTKDGQFF